MNAFVSRLKHEVRSSRPAVAFFFVAFPLTAVSRTPVFDPCGIDVAPFVSTTIAALVVAKVVLVVDLRSFVNRFPKKSLIYECRPIDRVRSMVFDALEPTAA